MSTPTSSRQTLEPSSRQIQDALDHLASLSSLLDSSSSNASDDHQPSGSRFPGLVEILPHLLAPLKDLSRLQGSPFSSKIAPIEGRRGPENSNLGLASLQPDTKIQPSNSLATYRPLISQVALVLSQVMSQIRSPEAPPERTREAIQIAEAVLHSHNEKRGREGEGLSIEEKRQIMLSRRKKRKAGHIRSEAGAESTSAPSSSSHRVAKALCFDSQVKTYAPSHAELERLRQEGNDLERISHHVKERLVEIRKGCRAFDEACIHNPAPTAPSQANKSKTDRLQLWLAQMVADQAERSCDAENGGEGGGRVCHGIVRARLPGVGDGLVWFDCRSDAGGWSSAVTRINLRSTAEIDAEDSLLKIHGITHLHLPSSNSVLKELTVSILRRLSVISSSSQDPLASITHAVISVLSLRSLYTPPPPTLEQLSVSRQRDAQLELLTGVEMTTEKSKQKCVGVSEWLEAKGYEDGVGDAVGIKWAYCCKEGEAEQSDRGQWLAFAVS